MVDCFRGEKKTEKSIKSRKLKKKKPNSEKKPIRILKKLTGSVQFYKPETEKIEPTPNKKNRAKPEK
jgi:hypothetical protein